MKMRSLLKLLTCLMLATLLCFCLLACDNGETASSSSSSSSSLPEPPPPPCEHTYTPTEAGCYCDKCKETFTHTIVDGACSDCGFVEDKSVDFSKFSAPFITKYYGNTKAAISLTFDDAQLETGYGANELLGKYGLRGTIFFILDYAGKNPRIGSAQWNTWMAAWQAIIAEGTLDIGNHSYHHYGYQLYVGVTAPSTSNNYETEIGEAQALLTQYFPDQRIISFATPGYGYCEDTRQALLQYGIRFNRGGGGTMNDPYSSSFNPAQVKSFQIDKGASATTANNRVDSAISGGYWCVETYHYIATADGSIAEGYDNEFARDTGTISREFCEEHYAYIGQKVADGDIWCGTFNDVAAYVLERKHTTVAYTASTETTLTLSISCNELKDVAGYDHPLTLRVEVPSGWATVSATQGGASFTARSAVESGRNYIYIDVLPNGGDIVLSNVTE